MNERMNERASGPSLQPLTCFVGTACGLQGQPVPGLPDAPPSVPGRKDRIGAGRWPVTRCSSQHHRGPEGHASTRMWSQKASKPPGANQVLTPQKEMPLPLEPHQPGVGPWTAATPTRGRPAGVERLAASAPARLTEWGRLTLLLPQMEPIPVPKGSRALRPASPRLLHTAAWGDPGHPSPPRAAGQRRGPFTAELFLIRVRQRDTQQRREAWTAAKPNGLNAARDPGHSSSYAGQSWV